LLDQTTDKNLYEIIVVDDGSTDNSREVISIFKDNIRCFFSESNQGLSVSANIGIRNAKSRYIVRVDSDDYVHPKFLEVILLGFEFGANHAEAVSVDYIEVDELGETLSTKSQVEEPIACGIAFKSEVFEQLGYYDETLRIYEEKQFMSRFLEEGFKIKNINLPLYRYLKHGLSLTDKRIIK
jgi:glycosyltransferase involved in cell wall biosynthesis